jgi:hypothetical protein
MIGAFGAPALPSENGPALVAGPFRVRWRGVGGRFHGAGVSH